MAVLANYIQPKDLIILNAKLAWEWKKVNPIPENVRVLDIETAPPEAFLPLSDEEEYLDLEQYVVYNPDLSDWALTQIRCVLGYEIEGVPAADAKAAAEALRERLDEGVFEGIYFPQANSTPKYEIVSDTFRPGTRYLRMVHAYELKYSQSSPREQT